MNIEQFFLEGLGHQSRLITDEASGTAAVVDPCLPEQVTHAHL